MRPSMAASRSRPATCGSKARRSPSLPGFGEGRWWVQDLAASLPARLIPAGRRRRARPVRRAGRQDDAARRGRPPRHGGRFVGKSSRTTARESRAHASRRRAGRSRCADMGARRASSTRSCSTRPARRPAPSAAIPKSSTARGRRSSPTAPSSRRKLLDRAAQWLKPGGALVYSVCSLEPQEGEEVVAAFLGRRDSDFALDAPAELPDFVTPIARRLGPHPARPARSRRRARRLLHGAACPRAVNPV